MRFVERRQTLAILIADKAIDNQTKWWQLTESTPLALYHIAVN